MWHPNEIRRLIAQLSGIALGIASVMMILEELQEWGAVRLGPILSPGELSRGSIGLFLLGLSLLLIALPALWGVRPIPGLRDPRWHRRLLATPIAVRRYVLVTALVMLLSLLLLFGGEHLGGSTGVLLQLAGTVLGVLSATLLLFLAFMWVDSATTPE